MKYVKESATSYQAAVDNLPRSGTQKARILEYIREGGGSTRDEIEVDLRLSGNAVRPRVKELLEEGHIEETLRTRPTRSGSQATVLVGSNAGPRPEQSITASAGMPEKPTQEPVLPTAKGSRLAGASVASSEGGLIASQLRPGASGEPGISRSVPSMFDVDADWS